MRVNYVLQITNTDIKMKTFHHKLGHAAGSTMTVKELKDKLKDYPKDMPVFMTWEGVLAYLTDDFCVKLVNKGKKSESCSCLIINAENY